MRKQRDRRGQGRCGIIADRQQVVAVLAMTAMQLGQDATASLKLQLSPGDREDGPCKSINAFESDFKHAFSDVVCLFLDPDIAD